MGKYMKKSKITSDVAVMELSQSNTSGVRTRARTLALQRLQSSSTSSSTDTTSYLQLRSRRLEKPPLLQPKETKKTPVPRENKNNPNRDLVVSEGSSRLTAKAGGDCKKERGRETDGCFGENGEMLGFKCEAEDVEAEACFGENCLEFEATRGRSTRESTPCSLIRGSDTVGTPGSTTKSSRSTAVRQRVTDDVHRTFPTASELEEFFAREEEEQHRLLMEKYNFDFVNDLPLPGRYEWVKVIP